MKGIWLMQAHYNKGSTFHTRSDLSTKLLEIVILCSVGATPSLGFFLALIGREGPFVARGLTVYGNTYQLDSHLLHTTDIPKLNSQ